MKIQLNEIPIRDVVAGYSDKDDDGVFAYGGNLSVRPAYQRAYVYKDKQRDEVVRTVRKDFPLNVLYWAVNQDGTLECLDGQQRLISICQYVTGVYSIDFQYFHNLLPEQQEQILDYRLMVYFCEGTEQEKLDWFRTINIAGEKLTDQELRNAIYTGPWLADAKKYFSKTGGPAYQTFGDYLNGAAIRQDYLETAISWAADAEGIDSIEEYMARHQFDSDASALWDYFRKVVNWVDALFRSKRKKLMKGVQWGLLYNRYGKQYIDPDDMERRIAELIQDEDVQNQKGIYQYVFDGDEKHLKIRAFSDKDKQRKYDEQGGVCPKCGKHFELSDMDGDHILPWKSGGHTAYDNLQMLCIACNRGGK